MILQSVIAKYLIGHHLEILQFFFKNYPKYLELIENASIFAAPFFNTNKPNIYFWLRLVNSAKMQKTDL